MIDPIAALPSSGRSASHDETNARRQVRVTCQPVMVADSCAIAVALVRHKADVAQQ